MRQHATVDLRSYHFSNEVLTSPIKDIQVYIRNTLYKNIGTIGNKNYIKRRLKGRVSNMIFIEWNLDLKLRRSSNSHATDWIRFTMTHCITGEIH